MIKKLVSDCLEEGSEGVYLEVLVSPNSSENVIKGIDEWRKRLKIYVKEKAECGKANNSIIKLISSEFDLPPDKIVIVQGERTSRKRLYLNTDLKEVESIITNILEGQ